MKKRAFNLLNFLALNVLFFALYLNFIHKDANTLPAVAASAKTFEENNSNKPGETSLATNMEATKKAKELQN